SYGQGPEARLRSSALCRPPTDRPELRQRRNKPRSDTKKPGFIAGLLSSANQASCRTRRTSQKPATSARLIRAVPSRVLLQPHAVEARRMQAVVAEVLHLLVAHRHSRGRVERHVQRLLDDELLQRREGLRTFI